MHDEPMRGRADEVKRIATDEGEFPEGARFYDPRIARLNNLRRMYEVLGSSLSSLPQDSCFFQWDRNAGAVRHHSRRIVLWWAGRKHGRVG